MNFVPGIQKTFRKVGLNLTRFTASPYEHLREIQRYKHVEVDLLGHKFVVADGPSFYWSYREIFIDQIYKFNTDRAEPVIVDCGSNYGTSILYFKSLYPKAKVTAIEPDPDIFTLLSQNVLESGHRDIKLLNKAVSTSSQPLQFHQEGADGGRVFPVKNAKKTISVDSLSLDDLIEEPVDFLKMDIEGMETDVICASKKLKSVKQLFIEYHSFVDSEQNLDKLLKKLVDAGFRYYIHTQFCAAKPLTEEVEQLGMDLQLNIFGKRENEI